MTNPINKTIHNIYVLCPDGHTPAGGKKTLYKHVDILSKHGFSASALHFQKWQHYKWFNNDTKSISIQELNTKPQDVLVVPDCFERFFNQSLSITKLNWLKKRNRDIRSTHKAFHKLIECFNKIVVLNLLPFNTFISSELEKITPLNLHQHKNVIAILTISKYAEAYLNHAFPKIGIIRYTKAIDHSVFYNKINNNKQLQLCFIARKKYKDAVQVLNILRVRNALKGVKTVHIDKMEENEVAQVMRDSQIYLSFTEAEGLPRPPMEAMLSKCLVIGNHGHGGSEFMHPEFCFPINEGDILRYAQTTEQVLDKLRHDINYFNSYMSKAQKYILTHYSQAQEEKEIVDLWKQLNAQQFPE